MSSEPVDPRIGLAGYSDPGHPWNAPSHRTGRPCVELGCSEPAGTGWSPLWCVAHNTLRLDRISASLAKMARSLERMAARPAPAPRPVPPRLPPRLRLVENTRPPELCGACRGTGAIFPTRPGAHNVPTCPECNGDGER